MNAEPDTIDVVLSVTTGPSEEPGQFVGIILRSSQGTTDRTVFVDVATTGYVTTLQDLHEILDMVTDSVADAIDQGTETTTVVSDAE